MPQWVESCVAAVTPSLKRRYPGESDDEVTSRAYAICNSRYKKLKKRKGESFNMESVKKIFYYESKMDVYPTLSEAMGGLPEGSIQFGLEEKDVKLILKEEAELARQEEPDNRTLLTSKQVYSSRLEESSIREPEHFFIKGEAIHPGTTTNYNTYLLEELRKAAPTLAGCPIQLDHSLKSVDNIGRVLVSSLEESKGALSYIGRIRTDHPSQVPIAVRAGDLDSVSIGANAEDLVCSICGKSKVFEGCHHVKGMKYDEGFTATIIGKDIEFKELSLTPVAADSGANVGIITHNSIETALVALAEKYTPTGGSYPLSDEENKSNENNEKVLEEKDKQIESLTEQLKLREQEERKTLAESVVRMELELGLVVPKLQDSEVKKFESKSIEALKLLSETLSKQVNERFRSSQPSSKGLLAGNIAPERADNQMSIKEAKAMIATYLGFDPPSPEAVRAVQERIRTDAYHPNRNYYDKALLESVDSGGN